MWDDGSSLVLLMQELNCRRPRKWKSELIESISQRLDELASESFPWPTTNVSQSTGLNPLATRMPPEGMLKACGYRVGRSGLEPATRQIILSDLYLRPLPASISSDYDLEWGKPQSRVRLQKLANCIATFARNAKRNGPQLDVAIHDWEEDLAYLKRTFYVGRYDFKWPTT
jgi:hypothetical protein